MSVIILGAGEMGSGIARQLSRENRDVVMIERDPERIAEMEQRGDDLRVIRGGAGDPQTLLDAGIEHAELLVAVTDQDEVNIAACLLVSRIAPRVRRVARIRSIDTRQFGHLLIDDPPIIDALINPEELCAAKVADLFANPGISDISWFLDRTAALLGVPVMAGSPGSGKSLIELGRDRGLHGLPAVIAAIVREGRAIVPSARDRLQTGDLLYVATLPDQVARVVAYLRGPHPPIERVTIFGGTNLGFFLARMLGEAGRSVRLIEPSPARAAFLSERLPETLVLRGDVFESEVFDAEEIGRSDVFLAATADQEDNIVSALHARSRGVPLTGAVLHRPHVAPLVSRIGIDLTIIPNQAAVGDILEYIRKGAVSSVVVLNQDELEVLEIRALQTSRLVGTPLRGLKLPKGVLILAVGGDDGRTVIPDGETVIRPGDRVVIILPRSEIRTIERLISVALEYF